MSENLDTMDIIRIMEMIPHRYPMLLVDRVKDIIPNVSATGIKCVTMNENFFQGHFPSKPVMPGVLIIEALAQAACVMVVHSLEKDVTDKLVYFMGINEAKFRKPVTPGDVLELKVKVERARGNFYKFSGKAFVGETLMAEANFSAMLADN
ncbi:MAG: 3-hydroxyacyl-ACP dehydratase FabZ [Sphingomonadales bacterium]